MKYLDDVQDGERCERLPVRGSTVLVEPFNGQPHPVRPEPLGPPGYFAPESGVAFFDAQGVWMEDYEKKMEAEFFGRELDAALARDIAAACRRDYPAEASLVKGPSFSDPFGDPFGYDW